MADVEKQFLLPQSPENVPAGEPPSLSACMQACLYLSLGVSGHSRACIHLHSCP